jgi:hypothetical protein
LGAAEFDSENYAQPRDLGRSWLRDGWPRGKVARPSIRFEIVRAIFLLNRALAKYCSRLQQQIARIWTVIAQNENEPPAKQGLRLGLHGPAKLARIAP